MKKILIIFVALAVLAPAAAHAFSFVDVINFGKRLIHKDVQPAPAEVKKETAAPSLRFSSLTAEKKQANWKSAFEKKNIESIIQDSRNLYFTDAEINYVIAEELTDVDNPPAKDVTVSFSDNLIKVSGYSLLKNFNGQFNLEAKITKTDKRIAFQVTRARFHNFYFPAFIAQAFLRNELNKMIEFLYSSPDYQNLTVTVGNGFIELNYGK